jgi:hypothetical protein
VLLAETPQQLHPQVRVITVGDPEQQRVLLRHRKALNPPSQICLRRVVRC